MAKKLTNNDRLMYSQFMGEFTYCMCCHWNERKWSKRWRKLENAHIVGGAGRRHDRRAIVRLCMVCHQLSHGMSLVAEGFETTLTSERKLPQLTRQNLAWLKQEYDPRYYDAEYLDSLAVGMVGQPVRPPEFFFLLRDSWR